MNSFLALACFATLAFASASVDYCKLNCEDAEHVCCNQTVELGSRCQQGTEVYDMTDIESFRKIILNIHNSHRNIVAGSAGGLFPRATRMLPMMWSNDLAKNTYCSLKKCTGEMENCFRTEKFVTPSQNMATFKKTADSTIEELIGKAILFWFSAVKYSKNTTADIASYPAPGPYEHEHPCSPSARMVIDHNPAVGCSGKEEGNEFTLLCYYAFDIHTGDRLWVEGPKAASDCSSSNPLYSNLCGEADSVNFINSL